MIPEVTVKGLKPETKGLIMIIRTANTICAARETLSIINSFVLLFTME